MMLVLYGWLILLIGQLVFGSIIMVSFGKKLVDRGWALGRISVWLLISLVVWFGSHLMPINTSVGVWVVGIAVFIFFLGLLIKKRKEIKNEIANRKWFVLTEEILFSLGYFWLCYARSFNPDILDLEKFMDAGLIQTYLKAVTLPVNDMWLAGETVNYYTFGHFMGSVMTRIWGIDLAYSYNLLLGLLMGLTLTLVFSVIVNLSAEIGQGAGKVKLIIGGVLGSLLVGFGGNSHTIWFLIKNQTWQGYWYADATRFIYNTIHEFPAYSFIVSDLHGHVWDLPIVLAFLVVLISWAKEMKLVRAGVLGLLLGVMAMTNTWDVLIYGLLIAIYGIWLKLEDKIDWPSLIKNGLVLSFAMVLVALPWKLNFESIDQGVRLVEMRTPLWQLLVLWSGYLIATMLVVIKDTKIKLSNFELEIKANNILAVAMSMAAIVLLVIPELIYVKDIYTGHPRANTMFKLTYEAFIFMSILSGYLFTRLDGRKLVEKIQLAVLVATVLTALTFPYFGYRDYYGAFKVNKGINGLTWMARDNPGDFLAVNWLRNNVQERSVILEAVGESYTKFGRISAFSGHETVLGWRVHEWLWRGGFDIPALRTEEVKLMYEKPESKEAKSLRDKYEIAYVVIGDREREIYKIDPKKMEKIGRVVFNEADTEIIEIALSN